LIRGGVFRVEVEVSVNSRAFDKASGPDHSNPIMNRSGIGRLLGMVNVDLHSLIVGDRGPQRFRGISAVVPRFEPDELDSGDDALLDVRLQALGESFDNLLGDVFLCHGKSPAGSP